MPVQQQHRQQQQRQRCNHHGDEDRERQRALLGRREACSERGRHRFSFRSGPIARLLGLRSRLALRTRLPRRKQRTRLRVARRAAGLPARVRVQPPAAVPPAAAGFPAPTARGRGGLGGRRRAEERPRLPPALPRPRPVGDAASVVPAPTPSGELPGAETTGGAATCDAGAGGAAAVTSHRGERNRRRRRQGLQLRADVEDLARPGLNLGRRRARRGLGRTASSPRAA